MVMSVVRRELATVGRPFGDDPVIFGPTLRGVELAEVDVPTAEGHDGLAGRFVQAVGGRARGAALDWEIHQPVITGFRGSQCPCRHREAGKLKSSLRRDLRRSINAARRIRTCNQGIQGPRVSARLGLSHPPRRSHQAPGRSGVRKPWRIARRPGARRRGLLLGLTPLVSEPSWPPMPGQAWLRIAVPRPAHLRPTGPNLEADPTGSSDRDRGFRFPAIHPVRNRRLPSAATFF